MGNNTNALSNGIVTLQLNYIILHLLFYIKSYVIQYNVC